MFKYNLDQVVFYLKDNKIFCSQIFSRTYNDVASPEGYIKKYITYRNAHGEFNEDVLFLTKEELLASL